ncbi:MAG: hypothetical protein ACE361_12890 [Aureliella sp.]
MSRVELLSTAVLLAIGTIGSVLFNWPVQSDGGVGQSQQVDSSASSVIPGDSGQGAGGIGGDTGSSSSDAQEGAASPGLPIRRGVESGTAREPVSLMLREEQEDLPSPAYIDFAALRRGDRLLTAGNYIGAHQLYLKLDEETVSDIDSTVRLRIGLSAEFAGLDEQAEKVYLGVIQSDGSSEIQRAWALLGLARLWQGAGQLEDAIELLSELSLIYGTSEYPIELRIPVLQRLSDCLQQAFIKEHGAEVIDRLQYSWSIYNVEPVLEGQLQIDAAPLEDVGEGRVLKVVQKPLDDFELVLIDARLPFSPLLQTLDELQDLIDQKFSYSNRARATLAGRSIQADAAALPLPVLLDQVVTPLGLVWREENGLVEFLQANEVSRIEAQKYQLRRVQRILRQIQLETDDQGIRAAAVMHEANNAVLLGLREDARNKYFAAREVGPKHELSAKLYLNTGYFHAEEQRLDLALDQFYRALDQSLAPQIQAEAYSEIGRLELELGRADKAIQASARGLRHAVDARLAGQALVTLCRSYLLEGDPYSANRVIYDNADRIQKPSHKRLATVYSSYARFQATKPVSGLQAQDQRLLLALGGLKPGDVKHFLDHLIIGRAYYDISQRSTATEHLNIAAAMVHGDYWKDRIRFELAEVEYLAGNYKTALQILEESERQTQDVLFVGLETLRANAKKRLGDLDGCIGVCRGLLAMEIDEQGKRDALKLLGEAYESAGDLRSASLCFAGLLPKETEVLVGKTKGVGQTSVD